ncbi:MAG: cytochrome d ubiquinol oxidase subunit II [Acidimicrobiia bacterium]
MEQGIWNLNTLWFTLIAVLWVGYFFLEGFDFGVGILLPFVSKDDADRRVVINSIGPVWDGNEVWLLVAGGATFAAFPEWYATLFSGFYLPLFLILVALIIRGVAFEYRGKDARPGWRNRWDWVIFIGSFVPALLWGVAFANIVRGVPIDAAHEYAGGFWNLLNPYALIGGLASLSLFTLHGALFLSLKTQGDVEDRARGVARNLGWISLVFMIAFLVWTYVGHASGEVVPGVVPIVVLALVGTVPWLVGKKLVGWAFVFTGVTIALTVVNMFTALYPNVMPSSLNEAYSLTVFNASASHMTLKVMTIVAIIFTPIVLLYQGWTYWVFRKRIGREDLAAQSH